MSFPSFDSFVLYKCTSHDREKANALFEIDPDNIKDLEQEKKVDVHLTNDTKYVKKPREKGRKRVSVN